MEFYTTFINGKRVDVYASNAMEAIDKAKVKLKSSMKNNKKAPNKKK